MSLKALFLDFNSYFASCEQHMKPHLRGRPIAVTPVMAESGCCIAASYEAKHYGVKTGTRVGDARRMCPGITIVEATPEAYVRLHNQLIEIINSCMWVEAIHSIDELHCPLTGHWQEPENALALAKKIKEKLLAFSPAIRCSIGLAPNTFLAKVATDMQKPDGLVTIQQKDLPDILYNLRPTDLPGINKGIQTRLERANIRTMKHLCTASRQKMKQAWGGVEGERFYFKLHGMELPPVPTRRNMIGHSHVLPPELRNEEGAHSTLFRLLHKACVRLRRERYYCQRLYVRVIGYDNLYWEDTLSFDETQQSLWLNNYLRLLWGRKTVPLARPTQAYIQLHDLNYWRNHSRPLFTTGEERQDKLDEACDYCYTRYGRMSIYYGAEHLALQKKAAPVRIAFNRIPDVEREF